MRKLLLLLSLLIATTALAQSDDEAAIRAAIDHYFAAHATGDGSHIAKVFHPELKMMWVREGKFNMRTRDEFIAGFSGKPADDEAQRKRTIEMIDVTGNAAIAKIRLDYPKVVFTDYFALLKVDGEWKVVTKIFHNVPR
jgi:hypothetical protein